MTISKFAGTDYSFLSNFHPCPVRVCFPGHGCWTFPSSENAYQAAKCPSRASEFVELTPGQSKKLGQSVELRRDWEEVKDDVMHDVVLAKFQQNPELAVKLAATGDEELIEGNTWGDRYWGQVDGVGKNMLGKTLMRVREELRGQPSTGTGSVLR